MADFDHIEMHHPTSLSHGCPQTPSGIEAQESSMIRIKVEKEGDIRVVFKSKVNDSNEYSELYGKYTPGLVTPQPSPILKILSFRWNHDIVPPPYYFSAVWTKNALNLKFTERMVGSTKVFDVEFKNKKHGLQNIDIERLG